MSTKYLALQKTKNHEPWRSAAPVGTAPLAKWVKKIVCDLGGWYGELLVIQQLLRHVELKENCSYLKSFQWVFRATTLKITYW